MSDEAIRFRAEVSKVTTLADGGIRIVLDIAETEIEVAKQMMQVITNGLLLFLFLLKQELHGISNKIR